ncbi:MAG: hypothetical protein H6Q68_521 [Firmicutes bacterium]|nr:hypothetical protein [Bacillota bacterium]
MDYENNKLQHTECHFCGQDKKCFVQVESDEQHIICPICLLTGDSD